MEVSEIYWLVVTTIADVIEECMMGAFFYRLVKPFMPDKRNTRLVGIVYTVVMLIIYVFPEPLGGSISSAIGVTATFIAMYFIDKRNVWQKVFLAVLFYLIEWISSGIVLSLWNTYFDLSLMLPIVQGSARIQFALYVVMEIGSIVLEFLVMAASIRLLHKVYVYKGENMTKKELALMLAPMLSLVDGRFLFKFFTGMYEKDLHQYIWDNHYSYNIILFIHQAVAFATIITVIIIYQKIKDHQRIEKEEAVLARQIEDTKKHIEEVERLYHDIRGIKHDMANHVMILEKLYAGNDTAKEYVSQLKESVCDTSLYDKVKSGNPVTDVILTEKKKEMEENKIDFKYEFYYPEDTKLNAFDISIILNNALNNAIEAAKECEEPYVHILSYRRNNAYMIEIKNSLSGIRQIDKESGLPITTKADGMHGFGLSNIRKVARKYCGDIDIGQNGKEFVLTVMLLLSE
ncbi:MAG: ATP-binding protein [Butyrivibrio sp.]|nr:ATP-binding protein [Butyrivibrio sp.]